MNGKAPMDARYAAGAAYLDGAFMPIGEAKIPITDWGYRRSDVTYDVVSVWEGLFFRLDEHVTRFRASMEKLRLSPRESDEEIKAILHRCVALAGLRSAYVAMDCLRGRPERGKPYHPAFARNYVAAFAIPWVSIVDEEMMQKGAHMIVADTVRIPPESVDPTAKNFHWGDLTRAQFEARDRGADFAILTDGAGLVTEGAGFNVFAVTGKRVVSPHRGALEGVTRLSVLELCPELGLEPVIEPMSVEALRGADEIFMTTTAGGVMPVSRIDGRMLCNDRPGLVTMKLHDLFWAKRRAGWLGTPVDYAAA
ncbi:MAG: aminotransferase class IV [Pikeienuella sp.]|uniref:aminotransferase class IV n=1 Tax=Pikeienuella sp. TaxID=2831957 RepID=UPI00391A85EA